MSDSRNNTYRTPERNTEEDMEYITPVDAPMSNRGSLQSMRAARAHQEEAELNERSLEIGIPTRLNFETVSDNIIIPEGTLILEYGSYESEPQTNITWPSNLVSIKDGSFFRSKVIDLNLPDSLIHIGDSVFNDPCDIESLKLPKRIEYIGESTFSGCNENSLIRTTLIKSLYIPDSTKYIGPESFSIVDTISIPNSIPIEMIENIMAKYIVIRSEIPITTPEIDEYDVPVGTKYRIDQDTLMILPGVTYLDSESFKKIFLSRKISVVHLPYTIRAIYKDTFKKIQPQALVIESCIDIQEGVFDNVRFVIMPNKSYMINQKHLFSENTITAYPSERHDDYLYTLDLTDFDIYINHQGEFEESIEIDNLPSTCFDAIQYVDEDISLYRNDDYSDNIVFVYKSGESYNTLCFSISSIIKFLTPDHPNIFFECKEGTEHMFQFQSENFNMFPAYFRLPLSRIIHVDLQEIVNLFNSNENMFYVKDTGKKVERSLNYGVYVGTTNLVSAYHCQEGSGFTVDTLIPITKTHLSIEGRSEEDIYQIMSTQSIRELVPFRDTNKEMADKIIREKYDEMIDINHMINELELETLDSQIDKALGKQILPYVIINHGKPLLVENRLDYEKALENFRSIVVYKFTSDEIINKTLSDYGLFTQVIVSDDADYQMYYKIIATNVENTNIHVLYKKSTYDLDKYIVKAKWDSDHELPAKLSDIYKDVKQKIKQPKINLVALILHMIYFPGWDYVGEWSGTLLQ
jgi:hypothetical protein